METFQWKGSRGVLGLHRENLHSPELIKTTFVSDKNEHVILNSKKKKKILPLNYHFAKFTKLVLKQNISTYKVLYNGDYILNIMYTFVFKVP